MENVVQLDSICYETITGSGIGGCKEYINTSAGYACVDGFNFEVSDTVTITNKEYQEMQEDVYTLAALREAGVDNWDGYGYAMEILENY